MIGVTEDLKCHRDDEIIPRHSNFLVQEDKKAEIRHLVTSTSWVQEDRKARSGISSTRLLGSKKTRRRDPASRHLDFLGPRRQEGEIRHLVNSTSWVQEDKKARSGISSPRLLGSKKTRRRDPASRQLDFLGPRRQEGEIRHLVNSTSWVQEDKKARSRHLVNSTSWVQEDKKVRSGISSPRLLGSKKTRRRSGISSTRLLGSKKTGRRDPASRQLDFLGPRRQEGEIRHLVTSTSWVQEDKKVRSGISSTRLLGSKKTRRRDSASRHLDFLVPRRQEGEIRHLVTSTSWVQEDKKVRSGISSTRLLGSKKTRRRDSASRHLDFLVPRRQEGEIRHLVTSTSWVYFFGQEDKKVRSGISSTRLLGSKKTRR